MARRLQRGEACSTHGTYIGYQWAVDGGRPERSPWRRSAGRRAHGTGSTELREFPMPDLPDDGALLKVEVAGICGTDVKMYAKPPFAGAGDHGPRERRHDRRQPAPQFVERHGPRRGRPRLRRALRRLLPVRVVPHRASTATARLTDWRTNPDARRYGYTSARTRTTSGAASRSTCTCRGTRSLHRVPDSVRAELAGMVTPLSNGIEWALNDGERRLQLDRADPGPGPAGALAGRRVQAGRRVADHRHRHHA